MSTTFTARIKDAARAALVATALTGAALGLAGTAHAELYGNPEEAADFWQHQDFDNCVLMATADMIGELQGDMISEFEITATASITPSVVHPGTIYIPPIGSLDDPNQGMGTDPIDSLVLLLAAYFAQFLVLPLAMIYFVVFHRLLGIHVGALPLTAIGAIAIAGFAWQLVAADASVF